MNLEKDDTKGWKKEYTIVIVLNLIYVLAFYYIMTSFK